MWDQVADVINHANFYLNRFKGYAAPQGQNLPYSTDLIYRLYKCKHSHATL